MSSDRKKPEVCYITPEMDDDFEAAIRLGADAGVKVVAVRSKVLGHSLEYLSDDEIARTQAVLDQYGMRVGEVLTPVGKCDIEDESAVAKHLDVLRRSVGVARGLGTVNVRVFPFRRAGFSEYEPSRLDEYLERIVAHLRPMVEIAEAGGVILCFECVGSTLARTSKEIGRVLDALGSPDSVAAIWEVDVGAKDGEPVKEGYPHIRGRIRDVHVKPNAKGHLDPIDDGMGTYREALQLLAADGYDGLVTIEHWKSQAGTLQGIRELQAVVESL
jgi:sugar phosphate isomerase/epimerase